MISFYKLSLGYLSQRLSLTHFSKNHPALIFFSASYILRRIKHILRYVSFFQTYPLFGQILTGTQVSYKRNQYDGTIHKNFAFLLIFKYHRLLKINKLTIFPK